MNINFDISYKKDCERRPMRCWYIHTCQKNYIIPYLHPYSLRNWIAHAWSSSHCLHRLSHMMIQCLMNH